MTIDPKQLEGWRKRLSCAPEDGLAAESGELAALLDYVSAFAARAPRDAAQDAAVIATLAERRGALSLAARACRVRTRALAMSGEHVASLDVAARGVFFAEQADDPIERARLGLASMQALGELGRIDDAIAAGEAARKELLDAGAPQLAGRADINLGIVRHRRGDSRGAVLCFDRARPVLSDDVTALGHLENSQGEAYVALGDFVAAKLAFGRASAAFERGESLVAVAIACGNIADLALRQGRLPEALRGYEAARRRFDDAEAVAHAARVLAEQAEAKDLVGLSAEAIDEYRQALHVLDQQGLVLEAARARAGLGRALLGVGALGDAETALAAAASGFAALDHRHAGARVDLDRAEIQRRHGHLDAGLSLAQHALATMIDRPVESVQARLYLARIRMERDEDETAKAELRAGLAIASRLDLAPLVADLACLEGDLASKLDQVDEAVRCYDAAVAAVERLRGTLQAERYRTALLGDRESIYGRAILARLNRGGDGDLAAAYVGNERARSRALLDRVEQVLDDDMTGDAEATTGDETLLVELSASRAELNAVYAAGADGALRGRDIAALQRWQARTHRIEAQVDELEGRLAASTPGRALLGDPADASDIARSLATDEALISYRFLDDTCIAFVLRPESLRAVELSVSRMQVEAWLREVELDVAMACGTGSGSVPENDRGRGVRAALGAALLEPLSNATDGATRLTIVPDGPLARVPFSALIVNGAELIESTVVRFLPSGSAGLCLRRLPMGTGPALVVGVGDEQTPGIEREARAIAARLGVSDELCLIGETATVSAVLAAMPSASIIHLAGHGRVSRTAPRGSGVRLADRWLTVRDLLATRLSAELVVLSGCETAGARLAGAGEPIGLAPACLAAGAKAVLGGVWRVRDDWSEAFMDSFHDRWHTAGDPGGARADALREACLSCRDRVPHPAAWAGYQLLGEA